MSFLLIIIILFLLYLWVWPGIKRMMTFKRTYYDPFAEAMRQAQEFARQSQQQADNAYTSNSHHATRKKKIDPNVGEYVRFTEINESASTQTSHDRTVEYTKEQQITDVEWEDIQ